MSFIEGTVDNIDLSDLHPSDYYKIGDCHGENGWPKDPAYISQPTYLEGYAAGAYKRQYLSPPAA